MTLALTHFPDNATAAQALTAAIVQDLQVALSKQTRALLLVSGGRSPLPFFANLSTHDLPWEQIDVSLVDERSVPFSHPDSNSDLVQRHLLTGRAQAARWLPLVAQTFPQQDNLTQARNAALAANTNPLLQAPAAIVLGIGTDGHTASLFNDAPEWKLACTTQERYVVTQPKRVAHTRIGLSLNALIAQKKLYVWSGGPAKLAALNCAKILSADIAKEKVSVTSLSEAGPIALLIANPEVTLHVFHSDK